MVVAKIDYFFFFKDSNLLVAMNEFWFYLCSDILDFSKFIFYFRDKASL